jgi:hypothetical protein
MVKDAVRVKRDIAGKKQELRERIQQVDQERREVSGQPLFKDDLLAGWRAEADEADAALRANIQTVLNGVGRPGTGAECWRSRIGLSQFLSPPGRRDIDLRHLLAAGSWASLRKIVAEELERLPAENFGSMPDAERTKKLEKLSRQLTELREGLVRLEAGPEE